MSNWGDGYRQGHKDALKKAEALINIAFEAFEKSFDFAMEKINEKDIHDPNKDIKGGPSQYAVANKCCGGIDAHDVGCRG